MSAPPIYVVIILPLGQLAASVACFYVGKKDVLTGLASRRWPSVVGTVQSLTPIRWGGTGPNGATAFFHRLYVRYFFDVDGKRRWGDWKSPLAATPSLALEKASLVEGGSIPVYYCPTDPNLSVAQKGLTVERLAMWLLGGGFLASAIICAILMVRLRADMR